MSELELAKKLQSMDPKVLEELANKGEENLPDVKITIEYASDKPHTFTGKGGIVAVGGQLALIGKGSALLAMLGCLMNAVEEKFGPGTIQRLQEILKAHELAKVT